MANKKILIGSPIRQSEEILKEFLYALRTLKKENLDIHYYFIDDNIEENSKTLLSNFSKTVSKVILEEFRDDSSYKKDDNTHYWDDNLIWKVASNKNKILSYARDNNFDFVFFVDSDLILNENTLTHLVSLNKDIVSEVFWTSWQVNTMKMPQVWMYDEYSFVDKKITKKEDASKVYYDFINMLKIPGVYNVGGLGACTLISKSALLKGVNFDKIYNLSFWGEDRHFCIRAAALGIELFADTTYPPLHIYRPCDLLEIDDFFKNNI